jgi:hypothetical protein
MQSAKGEPGAQRQAEAVATKGDTAFTSELSAPELSAPKLLRAEPPAVDTPADGRLVPGPCAADGSTVDGPTVDGSIDGSATGLPTGPARSAMVPAAAVEVMQPPPRRHPPVISRADLFGAVSVASLIPLIAAPLGWLWSRLAPTQLSVVQEDLPLAALPIESQHRFDDLATFALLGAAAGLLIGVATWRMRGRRGPLTVVGLAAGSLLAAWLAVRMGVSFAQARSAQPSSPLTPGAIVTVAPRLESNWIIIVQPLFAVLAYGIAAAANGLEDLGRRLT